ncbi:hypothetical protein PLICRDRAFT_37754 [Plicaturopsis crispa FD-325 SS-3]|nr:hypothetical protein PLICRDRAFT_37754 [Plicaturopsis crispa FD-325 SS-3]
MSKKGGKSQKASSSYELRDVVLAKIRGFPPWPGMVVDPDSVPPNVTKERPSNKKTTFYCVRFFPAGDFAWLVAKDLSKLQTHEIEAYINEPYKRSGDLLEGYKIALDPATWEEKIQANGFEAAEEEANAEVDQLDSEDENDDGEKKTKSKKRKRESDAAPAAKSKSKPKAKKDSAEPASRKKSTGASKSKKNGTKSKAVVESEDEGDQAEPEGEDEDAGPSKKASPPPPKKSKRDKDGDEEVDPAVASDPEAIKVRDWRHKLQKAFLSNKGIPKEEDMTLANELFTTVENYDKMNIQYLQFSKIGKVMRHIAVLALEKIPKDEEYHFRERAQTLVDQWHVILNANKTNGSGSDTAKPVNDVEAALTTAATANGNDHEDGAMQVDAKGETESPTAENAETADAPADPDTSVLADVTMSEAA